MNCRSNAPARHMVHVFVCSDEAFDVVMLKVNDFPVEVRILMVTLQSPDVVHIRDGTLYTYNYRRYMHTTH